MLAVTHSIWDCIFKEKKHVCFGVIIFVIDVSGLTCPQDWFGTYQLKEIKRCIEL